MKITEYPIAQFFDENDVLIKDGTNGTKQIKASDMVYALFDPIPEMHKEIFRGKSLGSTFTAAQQQAISDGSFHDLWLGDYWESGETKYRIVDFDYYYDLFRGTDGKNVLIHHVVVMPDTGLSSEDIKITSSNNAWNYFNSPMRTGTAMSSVKSKVNSFFGSEHIMTFYESYVSAIRFKGVNDDSLYTDRLTTQALTIEVPEVWHLTWGSEGMACRGGSRDAAGAFSLFRKLPKFIHADENRSIVTRTPSYYTSTQNTVNFLIVNNSNAVSEIRIGTSAATSQYYTIRPYFCLKG